MSSSDHHNNDQITITQPQHNDNNSNNITKKIIFITVGTTLFNELINVTTTQYAIQWYIDHHYTHLIIQYGKGIKPMIPHNGLLDIELYSFKSTLRYDIEISYTIISHAGAGTIMECLQLHKKHLFVVINTLLMDNHQIEIAYAMHQRQYLYMISEPNLLLRDSNNNNNTNNVWNDIETFQSKLYNGGNTNDFIDNILNPFFHIDNNTKSNNSNSNNDIIAKEQRQKKRE